MNINLSLKNRGVKVTLFRYAFPSVLSMWIFSFYSIVDGIFVGRGVGPEALAAVNLSMPFINFTFALSIMTSIGASTLISSSLGKNDIKSSRELFTHTLIFLGGLGVVICGLGIIFKYELAYFLGARGEMLPLVVEYLGTILFFNTFYLLSYALEVLIKVEGKPGVAMAVVAVAAVTNIILDYILVIVFPMGLRGAAIATGSAQLIQGIILLSFFMKKKSVLKFEKIKFRFKKLIPILKIGIPDSITEFSVGFTIFIFNKVLFKHYGLQGLTAFTIIGYINSFILMTMLGITQGMQPIVSFLNGQNNNRLKKKLFRTALKSVLIIGVTSAIFVYLSGRHIISLFISDRENIYFTLKALYLFSPAFIIGGMNIVTSGYFTALEDTRRAALLSLLRGIIFVPFFLLLLPLLVERWAIWPVAFISELLTLVVAIKLIKNKNFEGKKMIIQNS